MSGNNPVNALLAMSVAPRLAEPKPVFPGLIEAMFAGTLAPAVSNDALTHSMMPAAAATNINKDASAKAATTLLAQWTPASPFKYDAATTQVNPLPVPSKAQPAQSSTATTLTYPLIESCTCPVPVPAAAPTAQVNNPDLGQVTS